MQPLVDHASVAVVAGGAGFQNVPGAVVLAAVMIGILTGPAACLRGSHTATS